MIHPTLPHIHLQEHKFKVVLTSLVLLLFRRKISLSPSLSHTHTPHTQHKHTPTHKQTTLSLEKDLTLHFVCLQGHCLT